MSDEIVWVDGDINNLLVIFRKNQPDSSHYYYFPGEFSFPKVVKWADIEPVRKIEVRMNAENHDVYLSRVHYWGLVLWIDPELRGSPEGKPVCVFETNFHTPYLFMGGHRVVQQHKVVDATPLRWREKFEWVYGINYFIPRLSAVEVSNPEPYPAILQEVKVEAIANANQRFDLSSILGATHWVILIGEEPEVSSVKSALVDASGDITIGSLQKFLE